MPFALVLLADRALEGFFFLGAPAAAARFDAVAAHGGQYAGGLFAAHDGNARVGPEVEHTWPKGAPTHAVVPRAEGAADDHGEFGYRGSGYCCDHLRAVAGDAFVFVPAAHHEAGDVLQED